MSDQSLSASEAAPAKVNLTLHVTGQRADGYHLLDSLVVFVDVADRVRIRQADRLSLTVTGPRAEGVPADGRNLVWKAAELMEVCGAITLEKHLPAAAGIGGGSSDAAACLRALAQMTGRSLPSNQDVVRLGADVPVCLVPGPQRMSGVGERITPVRDIPTCWSLLVNPGVEVPTPKVFRALENKVNAPMPADLPDWSEFEGFVAWLGEQRNDLQRPGCQLMPVISEVLEALRSQPGVRLSRMSGSGATCFGLCAEAETAEAAARALRVAHPDWWIETGVVLADEKA